MGGEAIRTVKRWLEFLVAKSKTEAAASANVWLGGFFHALAQSGLTVSRAETGHAFFSFRVPAHLADKDGNWHAGAIASLIDDVGAATIASVEGRIKVSVDFDLSYFSPAKIDEEVEIEARVVGHRGRLSAVVIEVRKKGSREMVALARLWMSAARAIHHNLKNANIHHMSGFSFGLSLLFGLSVPKLIEEHLSSCCRALQANVACELEIVKNVLDLP